jgi:hypothetical protein
VGLHECALISYLECYSVFKVAGTVQCDIGMGNNHILGKEQMLLFVSVCVHACVCVRACVQAASSPPAGKCSSGPYCSEAQLCIVFLQTSWFCGICVLIASPSCFL